MLQPKYVINPGDIMIEFTAQDNRFVQVTDGEKEILILLEEDPGYTMSQLANTLSVSRKTVALRLKKLEEKGLIERIGSDHRGYWKVMK